MTKVHYNLPNGYASEITAAKEAGSFQKWINYKFGDRIRILIAEDGFSFDIRDDHFVVEFNENQDAVAFTALIGGRISE